MNSMLAKLALQINQIIFGRMSEVAEFGLDLNVN